MQLSTSTSEERANREEQVEQMQFVVAVQILPVGVHKTFVQINHSLKNEAESCPFHHTECVFVLQNTAVLLETT